MHWIKREKKRKKFLFLTFNKHCHRTGNVFVMLHDGEAILRSANKALGVVVTCDRVEFKHVSRMYRSTVSQIPFIEDVWWIAWFGLTIKSLISTLKPGKVTATANHRFARRNWKRKRKKLIWIIFQYFMRIRENYHGQQKGTCGMRFMVKKNKSGQLSSNSWSGFVHFMQILLEKALVQLFPTWLVGQNGLFNLDQLTGLEEKLELQTPLFCFVCLGLVWFGLVWFDFFV